jgi:hypothetical protein
MKHGTKSSSIVLDDPLAEEQPTTVWQARRTSVTSGDLLQTSR